MPKIFGHEKEWVGKAIESTWVSAGPFVTQLENRASTLLGIKKVVAVSNGTTALHACYLALNLKPGDEILLPGYGYQGAANLALLSHLSPRFIDVTPSTWCMDSHHLEKNISAKTKAIVAIHSYGNVCDMKSIMRIAGKHNVPVIEDCAESFYSKYEDRMSGAWGDLSTFSMQATKTITSGEGGLIGINNSSYQDKIMLVRSHGMRRADRYYWHEIPGHNFRLTNMQAAFACAQMERLDDIVAKRTHIYNTYKKCLQGHEDTLQMQHFCNEVNPLVWAIGLKLNPLDFSLSRDEIILKMKKKNIECRPGFYTPTQLPIYNTQDKIPHSEELAESLISPPMFYDLTDCQIESICKTLLAFRDKA